MVKHKTFKIPAANIQGKLSLWTRSVPETAVYILVYIYIFFVFWLPTWKL